MDQQGSTFGFRREEAIRCFQRALSFDKDCVMAHYFIAYNQAADYNNPDGMDYGIGFKEAQKALEMAQQLSISEWERALIEAQVNRFCWQVCSTRLQELHRNYANANAMRPVYQRFGEDDANISAFFAESLMILSPWTLWTTPPYVKPARAETEELVGVLEKALKKSPEHPGLCHYYIHAMELSDSPGKALPAADMLRYRFPEEGHLLHMPSHIDMWVGQYKEAIETNNKAVAVDEAHRLQSGMDNEMYKMYRMHNYHFAVWASMFDGQYATALKFAEAAQEQL